MSDQDRFDRLLVSLYDAMLEDARWSGLSGRLGTPSWTPALAREGGLAGPRPRSVRESDASLPGSAVRWRGGGRRHRAEPHGGCPVKPGG